MTTKRLLFIFFLSLFSLNFIAAQIYEPVKWTIEKKITGEKTADLIFKATIDDGWHVYGLDIPENGPRPTSIVFEKINNAKKTGTIQVKSPLHTEYDVNFDMELAWFDKEAIFIQQISFDDPSKVEIEGYIEYMVCNDQMCLPPTQELFSIHLKTRKNTADESLSSIPIESDNFNEATETISDAGSRSSTSNYWTPVIDELNAFGSGGRNNLAFWYIFFAGMLGGFLALFTPCIWPIIPMTVSFFLKRSENKYKGRRDAVLYGLSIIIIYVVLGILITLIFGASALNSLSTNAIFNLFIFALLVVFAISFFGAFEITLPSSWTTKLDAKAESTVGFLSILLMAFTLVLVSFSCTGPIIGTLLVNVSTTNSILAPAIGMLGFSVALAIPFSLFAIFPSWLKSLPKSGGWLNKVKVVLAFLELALALKFLSVADLAYKWRILDREVFLALWIVIFFLLGLYLLGKLRFPHDSEQKHTSVLGVFLAIISLSYAVYLVPGLWGAPLKSASAFAPPLYTQDFNLYNQELKPMFTDYEEGMDYAKKKNLPVVIDFTGYGCVNCRKMETEVWIHPVVKDKLTNDFVLISLYVDDKTELEAPYEIVENGKKRHIRSYGDKWSYLQRYKFGANAQPFYVMLDNDGNPLTESYAYDKDPENFIKWLNKE